MLAAGPDGARVPADLVLLQNPALDGITAFQLVEYLKRTGARAQLRYPDGRVEAAPGPVIVSVTSEADWVTRIAFPAGQIFDNRSRNFRRNLGQGVPSQGVLANRAHGHLEFLISHRARLENGEVIIERVTDAYNNTPFWVVQASREICRSHGDIYNPDFLRLVEQLTKLNKLYATGIQTWMIQN